MSVRKLAFVVPGPEFRVPCPSGVLLVRPEFLGLAADDNRVYLLVRFETADASLSFHRAAVYDVEDGAFVSARFFEDDPEAAVGFFSLAGEAS